jgi:hypothetical protein
MGFASMTICDGADSSAELIGWRPSLSAVETPATGDITEKEKPWEAYPKFTVYKKNGNPCRKCRHNASGCDTCLSPLEFKVRHTLKEKLWLQDPENHGKSLPKAKGLGQAVRFAKLADNEGTLKPDVAKMFQEACDEVRKALDADGLKDWNVKRSEMNKMMK